MLLTKKQSAGPIYLPHVLQEPFLPHPPPPFILLLLLALNFFLFATPLSSFNSSESLLHLNSRAWRVRQRGDPVVGRENDSMAIRDRRIGAPAGEQDRNQGKVIFFFITVMTLGWERRRG